MCCVSVIVPVYNTEKYLDRCISSILAQSLDSIEIVLVDDGSTDSSGEICDIYCNKYPQTIRTIHTSNMGLTSAWKTGSAIANGDYIGFVDSDDIISNDMYERLYSRALLTGADIVCCGIHHTYEDNSHKEWDEEMLFDEDVVDRELLHRKYFPSLINNGSFMGRTILPCRVTKLIKKDLLLDNMHLCADSVSVGEDLQISLALFLEAKKIAIIRGYYPYTYFMNNSSMTMAYDNQYLGKIIDLKRNLIRISDVKHLYDFKQQVVNDFLCLCVLNTKGCIYKQKNKSYKTIRNDLSSICENKEVIDAICTNSMNRLSMMERLFIAFMKYKFYLGLYISVRLYFG